MKLDSTAKGAKIAKEMQRNASEMPLRNFDFDKRSQVVPNAWCRSMSAEYAPDAPLASYPLPLNIDEVQYVPSIFRHIKLTLIGANRSKLRHPEK